MRHLAGLSWPLLLRTLASRNRSRNRDYIRPRLENKIGLEINFWSLLVLVPTNTIPPPYSYVSPILK